ncbi:MAG: anti-sigma factor antagonist [Atopobiaceae bacterium]|nr:anti-sigma factor antagonist [Atopobiaceae bacterium]
MSENMLHRLDGDTLTIGLSGRIDSKNAPEVEEGIARIRTIAPAEHLVLDCGELEYISSAGLRIILRLRKELPDLRIVEANPEVYDIFEMTGFTEMVDIQKAYRSLDVEGCEVIGQGANGKVYRIDEDTIVKVYFNADALPEIHRERELARSAFVLGIPTAIPYDVVRVGEGYGSVFELLNATSFAKLLASGEKSVEEIAEMSIELLRQIHGTVIKPGSMPDMKAVAVGWARFLEDHLEPEYADKLVALVEAVPDDQHMLHGDYHVKNVMYQNGEVLLIDMDTICHGHPIFELASMFNAYEGFSELDHSVSRSFLGIDHEVAVELWDRLLRLYLSSAETGPVDAAAADAVSEERLREVDEKARIIGYTRIMRRTIRRDGYNNEEGRAIIDNCRSHLMELIPKYDTLEF